MVTGAMAVATDMLPAAVVEATRASAAWVMHHIWAWLAVAVENIPAGVGAAAFEASGPWVQTASKFLHGLYGWLVTAAVEKLPDVAAEKLMGDAAAWFMKGHGVAAVYVTLALVLLAVAFVGGAVCALTCRTMNGPGLGGARVPRAVFEANPKRYYATVRSAQKARRRGACGPECKLLLTGLVIASVAYLAAKVLY
ncbi:hypothetical protein PR202_gn00245 [Eleusine coracana subsp. coracana]|uniref:Uncharacterized protein n=1 Tax=Eleusine coracana subsp. coracana TaxID=191504 RepID=A0AAV5G2M7_ELECO|nr:hypothetical protein PR202_gn00140 [Eleusine coracana subsp. coracana]GJN40932.1 hypothetical protein PR202_gn00245 [Eleusine coracana subsp. coracana]